MARIARSEDEYEKAKKRIKKFAFNIILKEGYDNLTMRKLAKRLDMSATNLYNYFKNKNELYIICLIEGYTLLYRHQQKILTSGTKEENFKSFLYNLIEFSQKYNNYYSILFENYGPKSKSFVETDNAQLAKELSRTANLTFSKSKNIICEYYNIDLNSEIATHLSTLLITQIHGITSFYNHGLLGEIYDNPDSFVTFAIDKLAKITVQDKIHLS